MPDLQERLFQTAASRLIPLAAHVDLTYRCNFRCTHCYIPEHGGPEMTTDEVLSLLDDLARAGTMFLVLSGGEVFLRTDLFEILERAKALGFHVKLYTDGYFLDERNVDRLAALCVPEVHVSLYSMRAEAFERITQVPGSLARVLAGIELSRARGIAVTLKCPVLKETTEDALGVLAFARSLGCEIHFDTGVMPQRDGCVDPVVQHTLGRPALRAVLAELASAGGQHIEPFDPRERMDWPLCGAGRSTVHIEPSGRVNPCVVLPVGAGNVRERRFAEIWRDSPTLHEIRGYRQRDRKGCAGCSNMGFCNFCMGRAYLSTGDPLSPAGILCHQAETKANLYRGHGERSGATPWEPPSELIQIGAARPPPGRAALQEVA